MRSVNKIMGMMSVLSIITFILYLIEGKVIFSIVVLSFLLVFLFGFREFGSASYTFRLAHVYVGSILFTIASGYVLLTYLFSLFSVFIGGEPYRLSISDIILLITGVYSLINVIYLKKVALRNDK